MEETKKTYSFVDNRGKEKVESKPESQKVETPKREELKNEPPKRPPEPMPLSIDLPTLIMSFASSAVIAMGKAPDPHTGKTFKNLEIARQNIEIITLLKEKTIGNLTNQEEKIIDSVLYDLRMMFVEAKGEK